MGGAKSHKNSYIGKFSDICYKRGQQKYCRDHVQYVLVSKDRRKHLADVPPSAKLVYKTLEYENELTQSQLAEETLLSPRTVRSALKVLLEKNVVEEEIYFADARKRLYSITTPDGVSDSTE
ncbi:winged helix-turn-helix transcriptional regulator (plasmid) [Haloarcula sp. JP-L23]|nr:winged helix-turn-helix transcriptional regulator [Haloarcula sp. JP-L23]